MTTNIMQVMTTGMVGVMTISIFSQALGIMMAEGTLSTAPTAQKPTDKAIKELKLTYGSAPVNRAIELMGADANIADLARSVDMFVWDELIEKYGMYAVETARADSDIEDFRAAKAVVMSIHAQGLKATSSPEKKEDVIKKSKVRGRSAAQAVMDATTGIRYKSLGAAGRAVAAQYDLDPTDKWVYYAIVKADPNRFKRV